MWLSMLYAVQRHLPSEVEEMGLNFNLPCAHEAESKPKMNYGSVGASQLSINTEGM